MTNADLLEYQQKKIKDKDQEIEEITGEVKKGKEMGKVIKTNLETQNKLLDDVETGMDHLDSKMSRTRKKFDFCYHTRNRGYGRDSSFYF